MLESVLQPWKNVALFGILPQGVRFRREQKLFITKTPTVQKLYLEEQALDFHLSKVALLQTETLEQALPLDTS